MMIEKVTSLPPNQRHSFFLSYFLTSCHESREEKNRRRERITEQSHENNGIGVLFGFIGEEQINSDKPTHMQ